MRVSRQKINIYAAVLAVSLIILFVIANQINSMPNTVGGFPWGLNSLPFPVVLFLFLRQTAQLKGDFSIRKAIRSAEPVVRYASLAFALFTFVYSLFFFGLNAYQLALWGLFTTLVGSLLIGLVFTVLIAWLITLMHK